VNGKYEHERILITGGCGFIGTNLARYLCKRGCRVRILDNLSTSSRIWLGENNKRADNHQLKQPNKQTGRTQEAPDMVLSTIDLMVGDIRDREVVERAADEMDAVVHLAAHTGVVDSLENPKENWDINVNGTVNLLEACRRKGVGRFIFASSNAAVGQQKPPIDELKVPQPISPYGASKLAGEALCSAYYYSFDLNTICLRFANCYGPYSEHKTGVITRFVDWAKQGKPLTIYGDGNQTRDFVHVDDVCKAIHLSLVTSDSRFQIGESHLFQIGSGTETSINQLAELMEEIVAESRLKTADSRISTQDIQLSTIKKPRRKGEIEKNYSDIAKAKKILGFEPKVKLREGLKELYSTLLGNGDSRGL
jgi:UDP-glucose 4-epimerase